LKQPALEVISLEETLQLLITQPLQLTTAGRLLPSTNAIF